MTRLVREVRRFAVSRPGAGVVAVSGGADSVALLRALHACGAAPVVAHVNHRLRGADSDADEAFVRALCADLNVECRVESVDVAARAAGDNLESTARRVRYEFFAAVARAMGAAWIATAHTADDQAETVLHRLIRGTGLQGLRGIATEKPHPPAPSPGGRGGEEDTRDSFASSAREEPTPPAPLPEGKGVNGGKASCASLRGDGLEVPFSPLPFREGGQGGVGFSVVRPLLSVARPDVLAYLAEIGQSHREDASNADTRFTRNRIRHELLPLLKTFNPDIVSALGHLAEHATEAHAVIVAAASELLTRAERPRAANTVVLDTAALVAAPRAVLRAALRLVWEREGWPLGDMSFDSWERAVEVAERNSGAWNFPAGVTMRHAGRVVQITRRE